MFDKVNVPYIVTLKGLGFLLCCVLNALTLLPVNSGSHGDV